jgi:hypothetical protein
MKRTLLSLVVLISATGFSNSAAAQAKIGYISTEELIGSMPETETANTQLQDYQSSLQQQGNDYLHELNEKDSLFGIDSVKMPCPKRIEKKRPDCIIPKSTRLEPGNATADTAKISGFNWPNKDKSF